MDDQKLKESIKSTPDKGIPEAIELYGNAVKAIVYSILSGCDTMVREEAWSDTFVKLWEKIDRYDPSRGASLKTYIGTIARNTAIDALRKESRIIHEELKEYDTVDIDVNIEDDFARRQNDKILHETIREMDEPDRSIFILRFFYELPVKMIAKEQDLAEKQVENILYRRKSNIRQALINGGVLND